MEGSGSGAALVCKECPVGGNCDGGFLLTRQGWWRRNNATATLYECPLAVCFAEEALEATQVQESELEANLQAADIPRINPGECSKGHGKAVQVDIRLTLG